MKALSTPFRPTGRVNLAAIVVVLAMVAGAASRASAQKKDVPAGTIKESTYAALADVPEKARQKKNPFEADAQALAAGRKLFEQHCAECHGAKAGGTRKGPSLLREEVQQATPGTLFWILSNGVVRRGMPVWSKLPEPQRWQIVTFLQSLKVQSVKN
jgi:mono/diheme cytochrome c family protein